MCGICGTIAFDERQAAPNQHARVRAMLATMEHRGPHGSDSIERDGAAIGANRLEIRSVGDAEPPLVENEQGVVVACNGEIDNHRELRAWLEERGYEFTRHTDIAVILPLYMELGEACVEQLKGVFALAIWDPRKRTLLLARDRAGERHLYYAIDQGTVHFATELAALRAGATAPGELDRDALREYLRAGYYPVTNTPFRNWHKVLPGELVRLNADGVQGKPYWSCPLGMVEKAKPSIEAFDRIFRQAVYRQSDIDVDFGVLLSGGLDSSLLTAVARSVRPERPLTAYGIRFHEASYDEGDVAARVAEHLGCDYQTVTVGADDFPSALRDLVQRSGEPLADPAWVPLSRVAERAGRDVRVVITGEGADELFGGYPTYMGARVATLYGKLPAWLRTGLRALIERLPDSDKKVTVSFLLKRFVQGQDMPGLTRHILWVANIQPDVLQRLGMQGPVEAHPHADMGLLDEVQRFDFRHSLPEALMAKADRGGMRHALEVRAPFLDTDVIDFAATLPERERVRGLTTKVFLKRYALKYLPRDIVHRRKRGLSVPLASWLRGPLYEWARAQLASDALQAAGIPVRTVLELLEEHRTRQRDHARALWTLIVISEWLQWAQASAAAGDAQALQAEPPTAPFSTAI